MGEGATSCKAAALANAAPLEVWPTAYAQFAPSQVISGIGGLISAAGQPDTANSTTCLGFERLDIVKHVVGFIVE